jgi:uncharacterized protein (TIGR02271 family)
MTTKQQLVVGVFQDRAKAEQAINELLQAGFQHHQIHFAGREAPTGGMLEKIKSLFTGQDVSAGGIYDDLVGMGVPPDAAHYYQSEFEEGRNKVVVQENGSMKEVTNVLVRQGGYGVNRGSGQAAAQGAPAGAQRPTTGTQRPTTEEEQRMKLREEELRVRKQPVETGEVRLHKDVVTEQKSMDVPVMHEEVYIERRPGSGQPSDQPIGQEETYRIPIYEEQVTVEKQPVEREEVSFGKRPVQETQRVTETTQREEPRIEHAGDVDIEDTDIKQGRDSKQRRETRQRRDREQDRE